MSTSDEPRTNCPSDGKPCNMDCHRGYPARPCDPPKRAAALD